MEMHITLRIVRFDARISDGKIAFPSEHKLKLVRNRSIPVWTVYLPVPEIGTKIERNDCVPVLTRPK